ncbi:MAG TPA: hypothetical protein VHO28_06370 [Ignavibacteriales bacterium]|nr:hypothetical protein [Ignavibacteriales bacterium]
MRKSVLLIFASLFILSVYLSAQSDDKPKKETAKKECCAVKKDSVKAEKACADMKGCCKMAKETKDSSSVK